MGDTIPVVDDDVDVDVDGLDPMAEELAAVAGTGSDAKAL